MKINYTIDELKKELFPILTELQEKIHKSSRITLITGMCAKIVVSEIIKPFKHLSLENNFKLVSYSRVDTCGVLGDVVAINYNEEPVNHSTEELSLFPNIYNKYNKILFCDGSPEGYLETIIFIETIDCLFNKKDPFESFVFTDNCFDTKKEYIFEPKDWTPKYYKDDFNGDNLTLIYRHNIGGISGQNYLYLCNYMFTFNIRYSKKEIIDINQKEISKVPCDFKVSRICIYDDGPCESIWNIT